MVSRYRKMLMPTRLDTRTGLFWSIVSLIRTLEITITKCTQGLMDILVSIQPFGFLHTKTSPPRGHTPQKQDHLSGTAAPLAFLLLMYCSAYFSG